MFPEISRSNYPHWLSNLGSTVSLDLQSNLSHNFLAMILCSKFSRKGTAFISVATTTDRIFWSFGFEKFSFDDYKEFSYMEIVPRTILPLTEDDSRIEFKAYLDCYDDNKFSSSNAEILGIHLLYKPVITIVDECVPSI